MPLIAREGQAEAELADVPTGLLLGLDPERQRQSEKICSRIIAVGLGDESVEDDVALVVVRRPS